MHVIRLRPGVPLRLAALLTAAATVLTPTAGCDSGDEPATPGGPVSTAPARMSPVPSNANYNPADVVFAQDMLANLQQAMDLGKLAAKKAADPEVRKLAAKAQEDRKAGVLLLPMWLERNQQPLPATAPPTGPGDATRPIGAEDLVALNAASGKAFDTLFLRLLIKIDEAATGLLAGQQWSGVNGPLMTLSNKLSADEQAEAAAARRLLAG